MSDLQEALKFYRVQFNRCKINLHAAKDRRDQRAVESLQKKMRIYAYTLGVLSGLRDNSNQIQK